MDLISRVAKWWLARSQLTNKDDWFYEWALGGQRSATGIVVSELRAMQEPVTARCVRIRAQDLAKLPVHVFRARRGGGQDVVAAHPLERLLRKPNAWQTWFEFCETVSAHYLLKGNGYAVIRRDGRARPVSLIPIQPGSITEWASGDALFYKITSSTEWERAVLAGLPDPLPAADVFHLRNLSFDSLMGLSPISLAREEIGLNLALTEHVGKTFGNGARPSGVLETDKKLSEESFKRFKSQWQDRYAGIENAGKTPLLEEGVKWKPQALNLVETQTVQAIEAQVKKLAIVWDVPLHRIGIIPEGGGAAILQAHQMYLNNVLSSDAERWEVKLNDVFGLDGENEFVQFDLNYFNRADERTQLEALRIGVVGVVITINEARARLGLPSVTGGDVLLQPTNVAPFPWTPPAASNGPGSDVSGEPAPGGDGDPAAVQDDGAKRLNGARCDQARSGEAGAVSSGSAQ
jgi:HK97 family phage portal protein